MYVRISLATSLNWNFVTIRDFDVESQSKIAIGRSKQCSLQVIFAEISRIHCVITPDTTKHGRFLIYNRSMQPIIVGSAVLGSKRIGMLEPRQKVYIFHGKRPIACFAITDVQHSRYPYNAELHRHLTNYADIKKKRYCNAFDYASSQESSLTLSSVGGLTSDESFCGKKEAFECKQRFSQSTKSCPSLPSVPSTPSKGGKNEKCQIEDHIYDDVYDGDTTKVKAKSDSLLGKVKKMIWRKINKCVKTQKSSK